MIRIVLAMWMVLTACLIPAMAAEKSVLAVLNLKAAGTGRDTAETVSEMLRTEFINSGVYAVVERAQVREIMKENELRQAGCTDDSCAVEIGKLLSARKVVIGTVSVSAGELMINIRLVDVATGLAESAGKAVARSGRPEDLDVAVRSLVAGISAKGGRDAGRNAAPARRIPAVETADSVNIAPLGDIPAYRRFGLTIVPPLSINPPGESEPGKDERDKFVPDDTRFFQLNIFYGYASGVLGLNIGGFANRVYYHMTGLQVAPFFNEVEGDMAGLEVAAFWNHVRGSTGGLQVAALYNQAEGPVYGAQVCGIINSAPVASMQLGLINYCSVSCRVQFGAFNFSAGDAALQVGALNYCAGKARLQIGLVNIAKGNPIPVMPIVNIGW
jgi:TolB-like protein